jgi:hypothetical protein
MEYFALETGTCSSNSNRPRLACVRPAGTLRPMCKKFAFCLLLNQFFHPPLFGGCPVVDRWSVVPFHSSPQPTFWGRQPARTAAHATTTTTVAQFMNNQPRLYARSFCRACLGSFSCFLDSHPHCQVATGLRMPALPCRSNTPTPTLLCPCHSQSIEEEGNTHKKVLWYNVLSSLLSSAICTFR